MADDDLEASIALDAAFADDGETRAHSQAMNDLAAYIKTGESKESNMNVTVRRSRRVSDVHCSSRAAGHHSGTGGVAAMAGEGRPWWSLAEGTVLVWRCMRCMEAHETPILLSGERVSLFCSHAPDEPLQASLDRQWLLLTLMDGGPLDGLATPMFLAKQKGERHGG